MYIKVLRVNGNERRSFSFNQIAFARARRGGTRVSLQRRGGNIDLRISFADFNAQLKPQLQEKDWQARGGGKSGYIEIRETS